MRQRASMRGCILTLARPRSSWALMVVPWSPLLASTRMSDPRITPARVGEISHLLYRLTSWFGAAGAADAEALVLAAESGGAGAAVWATACAVMTRVKK